MAHYSIPNLSPASGRISTRSLRPSRKQNKTAARYQALTSTKASAPWLPRFFNAQRPIRTVGHWMFNIGRHAFFAIRRVKGAWWPSRSSKPSLPRKWRGRFDSYPLRHFFAVILSEAKRSRRIPRHYVNRFHRDSSTSLGITEQWKRR